MICTLGFSPLVHLINLCVGFFGLCVADNVIVDQLEMLVRIHLSCVLNHTLLVTDYREGIVVVGGVAKKKNGIFLSTYRKNKQKVN